MRNDLVRAAVQQLSLTPDEATQNDFYRNLSQGYLLLAVSEVPVAIETNRGILQEDTSLTILTTTMPNGGTAILAFTDIESVHGYAPGKSHVAMRSPDVLEAVIDEGYDALIVNAAGPWAVVPREDVLRILKEV
jgi:hypothetical protein